MDEVKDSIDCNAPLRLLCLIAQLHGIAVDVDSLAHQLALTSGTPQNYDLLKLAAGKLGLKASQECISVARLHLTPLPALTCLQNGQWVIVAAANTTHVMLQYEQAKGEVLTEGGEKNRPRIFSNSGKLTLGEFGKAWLGKSEGGAPSNTKGQMLLIASRASFIGEMAKFDFSWFIPSLVRYRRFLTEVLGTSIV